MVSRIPLDLQAVFVASNQGQEVHKPPPSHNAFKVFRKAVGGVTSKLFKRYKSRYPRSNSVNSQATFLSSDAATWDVPHKIEASCPQGWIESFLQGRGYSTERHNTVTTSYFNSPTPLQLASYSAKSVQLSTSVNHEDELRQMLACGISLNACNIHCETLMHKACRLGFHQVLRVFLEFSPELKVCDSQGRTLLHDTCWGARPSFQAFSLLIQEEPELLFMADCRGACPLDYVQKEHYSFWTDFLEHNADRFWPCLDREQPQVPTAVSEAPNSRPIEAPHNALPCELAALVAAGRMKPEEALILTAQADKDDDDANDASISDSDDESITGSDDESISDCEYENDASEESSEEADDRLLQELGLLLAEKK